MYNKIQKTEILTKKGGQNENKRKNKYSNI